MVRPPCCDLKKGPWTREEDLKTGNWTTVSQKKGETSLGMKRCGKSCRVRWTNDLKPISKNESFTPEEEELIIKLHAAIGSRWAIIAQQLPGRTDNDIKNKWNTKLKKKLKEMGIDPVTHKPFSQIFADYGNIGAFCSQTTNPNDHITGNNTKMDLRKHSIFPPPNTNPNINTQFSNYHNVDTTHSLDLLSQLQAINLVAEGSRANSSSNYNINAGQNQMPESFSWHDFLQDPLQEQNGSGFEMQGMGCSNGEIMSRPVEVGHGASSSSSSTSNLDGSLFLEAMLDQENDDMFLNFPGLMEEPLY